MQALTAPEHERRAKKLDASAHRARNVALAKGETHARAADAMRWHSERAKGLRHRFENLGACQKEKKIVVTCNACNSSEEKLGRCRIALLCVSCRGKIGSEKRGAFLRSRRVLLELAKLAGLLRRNRKGGRYGQRLVTLTAPHLEEHGIVQRIELLKKAWPHFLKTFNAFLREKKASHLAHWMKNTEWTPGADGKGHPHIHFWAFGPYLPQKCKGCKGGGPCEGACMRRWWQEALTHAGYPAEQLAGVLPHVTEVENTEKDANELFKYLFKDIVEGGEKLAPEKYAAVYQTFLGTRTTQGSSGFRKLGWRFAKLDRSEGKVCQCGGVLCFSMRVEPLRPDACAVVSGAAPLFVSAQAPPSSSTVDPSKPASSSAESGQGSTVVHFSAEDSAKAQERLHYGIYRLRTLRGLS